MAELLMELLILHRLLFINIVELLGALAKLRKAVISFVLSVRPSAWKTSLPLYGIFLKFDI